MVDTTQPRWTLIANIGDVNPIDHGGFFIYRDTTGRYTEEAEVLIDERNDEPGEPHRWTVYRFPLDRCSWQDGVVSDNAFHPEIGAWFDDSIEAVASASGADAAAIREYLCCNDPIARAYAYRLIAIFHGWENFDSDPLILTDRREVEQRYGL